MNRNHYLLVAVLVAGALVLPSMAGSPSGGDRIHEDIVLHPHNGSNGAYASFDEDGELQLDFGATNTAVEGSGVNPNAKTPVDDVFNVTYTGSEAVDVWLTTELQGVTFYQGDDQTRELLGESNAVTLGPTQTLEVGVLVDTTGPTDFGHDEFTIHADGVSTDEETPTDDPPATTTEPPSGTTTEADGGSGDGDFDLNLNPGSGPADTDGTTDDGPIEPDEEATIIVTNATLESSTTMAGESVVVNTTVENVGDADGQATIRLYANNESVASGLVRVPAGETRTVAYRPSFPTPGEYELRVEDEDAGTLLVRSPGTGTPVETTAADPAGDPGSDSSDGFDWPLLLVVLALAAVLAVAGYKYFAPP